MNKELPINKNILRWARLSIGFSISDVAIKMKKSEEDIARWEAGTASPTYPQLEKLAYKIYKRPIAVFFFPAIPEESEPKTEFRTLPGTLIEKLPVEIIKMYRKAKVYQFNLAELFENEKPLRQNLLDKFSLNSHANVFSLVEDIRNDMGYSTEDQFSWESTDIALKKWRQALENRGIFIFKDAFQNDDFSGFCVYSDDYPIIYINNSTPNSRQIFTLFHELGHLLYHMGGIDFRDNRILDNFGGRYLSYERICNMFAGEMLVPQKIFLRQKLSVNENAINELADKFSVSREVILRKYLDNNLIDERYYRKMVIKWAKQADEARKERKAKKDSKGHYYYTKISYLGNTYIDLVFRKYYQNRISSADLSSYLDIKAANISTFEHYAFG